MGITIIAQVPTIFIPINFDTYQYRIEPSNIQIIHLNIKAALHSIILLPTPLNHYSLLFLGKEACRRCKSYRRQATCLTLSYIKSC